MSDNPEALRRLWPIIEKAMGGLVFTADKAGEVAADMATVRAALAQQAATPAPAEPDPRTDDGAALRLSVKLGIAIDHSANRSWAGRIWGTPTVLAQAEWHEGSDPYTATRRAIVRAAEALGAAPPATPAAQPADEREAFLAWIKTRPGHPFAGAFTTLMWAAWQARAALEGQG